MPRTFRISVVISFAVASGLAVTGCVAGEQSVEEACPIVKEDVDQLKVDLSTALAQIATGEGTAETFDALSADVAKTAEKIKNKELKAALGDFGEVIDRVGLVAEAAPEITSNPDELASFIKLADDLKATASEIDEICGLSQ